MTKKKSTQPARRTEADVLKEEIEVLKLANRNLEGQNYTLRKEAEHSTDLLNRRRNEIGTLENENSRLKDRIRSLGGKV